MNRLSKTLGASILSVIVPLTSSGVLQAADLLSSLRGGGVKKRLAHLADLGVNDGLEPRDRGAIGEHALRQKITVDRAVDKHPWEGALDSLRAGAAVKGVDGDVGVEHRRAFGGEHCRHRRFAHGDRAGQANDDHAFPLLDSRMSASISARNCGVTSGRTPNQRSKPGAA